MFKISSKVKYSSLILLLAVVVMFYSTALPFSAKVSGDIVYNPVVIDIDELAVLVEEYSALSYFYFNVVSGTGTIYGSNTAIPISNYGFANSGRLFEYAFVDSINNSLYLLPDMKNSLSITSADALNIMFYLQLPFDFYIGPDTRFTYGFYFQSVSTVSGSNVNHTAAIRHYVSDEVLHSFIFDPSLSRYTTMSADLNWLASDRLMEDLPEVVYNSAEICIYNLVFNSGLSEGEYINSTSLSSLGSYISFSSQYSFNNVTLGNQIWFPGLILYPFTIYVPEELAPTVENFLDAITDPSPESAAEVERLEQELQDISEQLREDASDLEVEKPDISDSVEDLPSEVVDGMDEVGQTVLSPLMSLDLIATLFSVLFGVVALKLILFGSGTS